MICDFCFDARPHPGPLPRGEGESFAVAGEFGRARFAHRFSAKSIAAETARAISEPHETPDCHSLSPGERARVRASVQLTSLFLSHLQWPHRPGIFWQHRDGKSVAVAGGFQCAVFPVRFDAKSRAAGTARATSELHEMPGCHSLSPGERARVRASVPLTSLFLSHTQRSHRPGVIRQRMRRSRLQLVEDRVANRLLFPTQVRIPKAKFFDPH